MYIGRFLVVTPSIAAYRVSSRSFPDRQIIQRDDALAVVPTQDAPATDNPYVSYHCVRLGDEYATIGNGSHVDPIAEKLTLGYPARDALATGLLTMDYEKDAYDTPRIAAVLGAHAYIGIVRRDAVIVERVDEPTIVATYERDAPTSIDVDWTTAEGAARESLAMDFDHPVCAAAVAAEDGFEVAIANDLENAVG